MGEKREWEREGYRCFVVSWLVNHTPLQEMQHQRLQYQTKRNGMCTASITNASSDCQSFSFLSFVFCANCLIICQQDTPKKAIGLAKAQCMIGIVHFQHYCVGTLILLWSICNGHARTTIDPLLRKVLRERIFVFYGVVCKLRYSSASRMVLEPLTHRMSLLPCKRAARTKRSWARVPKKVP